jgi:hypothetical protein
VSKYWNNQGQYQGEFDQLTNTLMPAMGAAETVAGELVRAANRIYYDAFNNGFCNNTSGALKYLERYLETDAEVMSAIRHIAPKTNSGGYSRITEETERSLDLLVDRVVENIRDRPELLTMANEIDLLDLQEPDYCEYDEDFSDSEYDED